MPINWDHLNKQETETLLHIIEKAKAMQNEAFFLIELQEKRKQDVADLIGICRRCQDDSCRDNIDCEVKKAYALLYNKQEFTDSASIGDKNEMVLPKPT